MPELGGGGQLAEEVGGGRDGGGGGGDGSWLHGFSHAEHIVHSIWYFEVVSGFDVRDKTVSDEIMSRSDMRKSGILRILSIFGNIWSWFEISNKKRKEKEERISLVGYVL